MITKVKFTENVEEWDGIKLGATTTWVRTGKVVINAWKERQQEELFGTFGKDLFTNLNDANLVARMKLTKALTAARKRLETLEAMDAKSIEVESNLKD